MRFTLIAAVGAAAAVALGDGSADAIRADADAALTARLQQAFAVGDDDELARLAQQGGARILRPLLRALDSGPAPRRDGRDVRAAILAAAAAEDAHGLLDALAGVAGDPDRALAAPAARAGAAIADRLDGETALRWDLAGDDLTEMIAPWQRVAAAADRWADVRVLAMEVCAHLTASRRLLEGAEPIAGTAGDPDLGFVAADAAADPDPEVRRAAFELMPQPLPAPLRALAAAAIRSDADAAVAVAAAQAMCSELGGGTDAAPVLAALGDAGRARLRALATRDDLAALPAGGLIDLARCLAADDDRASARALSALRAAAPGAIRRGLDDAVDDVRGPPR